MVLLKLYIIFSNIFFLLARDLQNSVQYVYSSLPFNELSSTDSNWTPLVIRVATDIDVAFVSSGFSGITIIEQQGGNILFIQSIQNYYIQSFDVSSNGEYVFIGYRASLLVYKVSFQINTNSSIQVKSFSFLYEVQLPTDVLKLIYDQQYNLLIAAGRQGNILAYDTSNLLDIQLVGSFNTKSDIINDIFLSKDRGWLYVASDVQGLYMLKINQSVTQTNGVTQKTYTFLTAGYGSIGLRAFSSIATSDNEFIFAFDFWYGFFYANSTQVVQASTTQYPVQLNFTSYWPFQQVNPTCQVLQLNQDEKFLFLGVRSQGLYIFDVEDRSQIRLFQQIKSDSLAYSIQFSKTEDYLYFSNAISVFTFQKESPNLNDNYPNLFNTQQIKFDKILNQDYKWRCYTDQQNEYLIGTFDYSGMFVFPIHQDPYRLDPNNVIVFDTQVDSIIFESTNKYFLLPYYFSSQLIGIYQFAPLDNSPQQQRISWTNFKNVKNYPANETQVSEMLVFSYDKTIIVQTYAIGLIIHNSTDIFNIQALSHWYNPDFMLGENQGACITKDNKWVLSTIRLCGVYLLNITDIRNPTLADYIITLGGESITTSLFYNYAYLVDGIKGFAIIDTSYIPKLKIISRVNLPGYSVMMMLLQEEDYVLVTTMEKGMLTLIDIRDKHFPTIVNILQYGQQQGEAICTPFKMNYLFLTSPGGILTLPLFSAVEIHSNLSLVTTNVVTGVQTSTTIEKSSFTDYGFSIQISDEYIFQVGQLVEFDFALLYPIDENMHISDVFAYYEGETIALPSYYTFNLFYQSVQIAVNQAQLGSNRTLPNLNIFLLKTVIPLNDNSFLYSSADSEDLGVTNSTQSSMIYQYLSTANILDSQSIISESFDFTKQMNFDNTFQNQLLDPSKLSASLYSNTITAITKKVILTLKRSYYINPIKFYVISSLSVNIKSSSDFITSISSDIITITLQISSSDGKLLIENHTNVIMYLSNLQDQLKIQGVVSDINSVLQQQIIFANKTYITTSNSPNITITINDGINFPLVSVYKISDCLFIKLKKQIQVNNQYTLQNQFNKQFQNGVVDIESDITISFVQNTFVVEDMNEYTFVSYYQNASGEYVELPPNLWLQILSDSKLSFKGTTTSSMYLNKYTFKVVATDGYTQAVDYFTVSVSGIPFTYVLNLLLKILGPTIAIIGMYQHRCHFLNIIFEKTITFSDEEVICDTPYTKQFIIAGNVMKDSRTILRQLFNKVLQSKDTQKEVESFGHLQNKKINKDPQSDYELQLQNIIMQEKIQSNQSFDSFGKEKIKLIKKPDKMSIEKTIANMKKFKKHLPLTVLEKRYLNIDGSLKMSQVVEDIQTYGIDLASFHARTNQHYEEQIKNNNTRIYRAIRALVSRYLLSLDKRSQQMYQYIKYHCYSFICRSSNDWFKAVVKIRQPLPKKLQQQFNTKYEDNIFPNLELKNDEIHYILTTLQLMPKNLPKPLRSFKDFVSAIEAHSVDINLYLIREVIFADFLGFSQYTPSSYQPAIGQCIHLNAYEIKQIIAFKKRNLNKWVRPIYKFFNLEYSKYGVSKNMRLPTWIQIQQKHGQIILLGTPQVDDIEEILIRIYDTTGYTIMQYKLRIEHNQLKEKGLLSHQVLDEIYGVPEEYDYINRNTSIIQSNQFQMNNPLQSNSFYCNNTVDSFVRSPVVTPYTTALLQYQPVKKSILMPKIFKNSESLSPDKKNKSIQHYQFRQNKNSKNTTDFNQDIDASSDSKMFKFPPSQLVNETLYSEKNENTENYTHENMMI